MPDQTQQEHPTTEESGCLGGIVRLLWLAVGNVALFFITVGLMERRALSILDVVFWATVAGLIVIRYIDITTLKGLTADGKPASLRDWRRYVVVLLVIAVVLRAVAYGIAYLTMSGQP